MADRDIDTDKPASEQFDLSTATNSKLLDPGKVEEVAHELEKVPDSDLSCHGDEFLANLVGALKRLENAAEEARKDGFEDELSGRVDEGETVGPVRKLSGSSSYVADTEGAFAAVAESGADPAEVAKVKVGALRDVLGNQADEYLGAREYSYFRRVD